MRRLFLSTLLWCAPACADNGARLLDDFSDASVWNVQHTDDVTVAIASVSDDDRHALRLDFDFTDAQGQPINGYATAHRALALDLPANYELAFRVRGDAPVNNLQFKLIDASGENVWWLNRPDFTFTHDWQEIHIKRRQLAFAWGPASDRELKHAAAVEFVVASGSGGGNGSAYFDNFSMRELPAETGHHADPVASASSSQRAPPRDVLLERTNGVWCSASDGGAEQTLDVDFRELREFGGITLDWQQGTASTRYDVQFSNDGKQWQTVRRVIAGNGGSDALLLTESETRHVRIAMHAGESGWYCLQHLRIEKLEWGASPNAFFAELAKHAPRGDYPRGFSEQPYWAIVGVDGGPEPALISEDGAIEPVKGGFSIEPFIIAGGKLLTWADVNATQSLADGYLPIPRVEWKTPQVELAVEAYADGDRNGARLLARYRVVNRMDVPAEITLALAVRPFQVNPPAQFLSAPGGASRIVDLGWDGTAASVNGRASVIPSPQPDAFVAGSFDSGSVVDRLHALASAGKPAGVDHVHDDFGFASGAMIYRLHLPARGTRVVDIEAPMHGAAVRHAPTRDEVVARWQERLDRVHLQLPPSAQRIADALRSAHAQILMSRDGPSLRPGTRSYARSWIRDGAMIADALLRLGDTDTVRDYVAWYAPHQFRNGKVPCCVDARGSDPVPENDSEGELIHAIAQLYRYGGDRPVLDRNWPHIATAITYMDAQRASETGTANPAFRNLMPASISHEGYSAKPMHSYWDDFWALTGYTDAAEMAQALGRMEDAARITKARDAFRADLQQSVKLVAAGHAIDYVPGCAELGDFDATSTTIALSPGRELGGELDALLHHTFERYWREFTARSANDTWKDYTPYEWRSVGSFVRLGWRERAQRAIDFFFASGARPLAWNQWAEVVGRELRQIRFIGDMPHAWVASDFIRAALDLFAYERDGDKAIVIAAGVDPAWLAGAGVGISGLRTPYGNVGYHIAEKAGLLELRIDAGAKPPGGFVLPWPYGGAPGSARIDGKRVAWIGNELHIAGAPALVTIELATGKAKH